MAGLDPALQLDHIILQAPQSKLNCIVLRWLRRRRVMRPARMLPLQQSGSNCGALWVRGAGLTGGLAAQPTPLASIHDTKPSHRKVLQLQSLCLYAFYLYLFHTTLYIYSRKRMLDLEDTIKPVQCLALSPVSINEKGKAKKLKVVGSKKT